MKTTLEKLIEQATPLPWVAIKGDVLNADRTWGISKYLTLDQNREVDGDDALPNTRTEVIAEVCSAENHRDKMDAVLIAHAVTMLPKLVEALEYLMENTNPSPEDKWVRSVLAEANNPEER